MHFITVGRFKESKLRSPPWNRGQISATKKTFLVRRKSSTEWVVTGNVR